MSLMKYKDEIPGSKGIGHGIGGDPGGDGGDVSPPQIFLGGIVPPSIFESLKNIYSYICILNTMKVHVIQSV